MYFKEADFQNFMSFKKERFLYENSDLSLVSGDNQDEGGSNGAGKTSMITDTISWALFGKSVRGLKGDDVIHRSFKKDCYVHINLDFDGKDIWVKRYRKHKEFGDRLWLEIDGAIKEFGTMAQTEDYIVKFFGIDFDLFRCTVVFAQEETFNFINSGNKSQKDILAKIMRVTFDDFLSKAKASLKELKTNRDAFDRQLSILKSHVVDISEYQVKIAEWKHENNAHIKELHAELVSMKESIVEKQLLVQEKMDVEELRAAKEKLVLRRADLKAQANTIVNDIQKLQKSVANSEELFKVNDCPSCLRPIDGLDYAERLKEIDGHILHEEDKLSDLKARLDGVGGKINKVSEEINQAQTHNNDMDILKSNIETSKFLFKNKKEKMEEQKKLENPFIKQRDDALAKQKQIQDKIVAIEEEINEIDTKTPYYSFWELGFGDSGIKSFIFDIVCSSLTTKANKYLNTLTNGSVSISFDTQQKTKKGDLKEKFDCEVISSGERVKYEAYSGGEKRRIALAVDMSLSDLMCDYYKSRFNILVMDEQDIYLDHQGRESLLGLLKEIAIDRSVYVVAHDAEFKAMFDKTIKVIKKDKISRIEL